MEEVFGPDDYFKNEIIWSYRRWPTNTPTFQSMHDNLLWFSKTTDNKHTFNRQYERASERTLSDYGGKKLTTVKTEEGSFVKRETDEVSEGVAMRDVWEISREHPRGMPQPRLIFGERAIKALGRTFADGSTSASSSKTCVRSLSGSRA
jgi:DNA methylase